MNFSITQNGEPLDPSLYTWDEETRTLFINEDNLVLDFSDMDYCTFNTGSRCTFKTGADCTFKTGSDCTFNTRYDCTFDTGSDCIFKTSSDCIFKTGANCIFKTGANCIFKTGANCTGCVVIRRDIYEVIELKENQKIKLLNDRAKGFEIIEDKNEK